ncbi:hypothetical protein T484DRAFT_1918977 [Baffinella frigidus]|nr:hypothetical protein T484DRAFT_1918977 [Cryptophyta sp. CCMP2293]
MTKTAKMSVAAGGAGARAEGSAGCDAPAPDASLPCACCGKSAHRSCPCKGTCFCFRRCPELVAVTWDGEDTHGRVVAQKRGKRKIKWFGCPGEDSWVLDADVKASDHFWLGWDDAVGKEAAALDGGDGSNPPAGKRPARSNTRELHTARPKSQLVALYVGELMTLHFQRRDRALSHRERALRLIRSTFDTLFLGNKAHVSGGMIAAAWPRGEADAPHFGVLCDPERQCSDACDGYD